MRLRERLENLEATASTRRQTACFILGGRRPPAFSAADRAGSSARTGNSDEDGGRKWAAAWWIEKPFGTDLRFRQGAEQRIAPESSTEHQFTGQGGIITSAKGDVQKHPGGCPFANGHVQPEAWNPTTSTHTDHVDDKDRPSPTRGSFSTTPNPLRCRKTWCPEPYWFFQFGCRCGDIGATSQIRRYSVCGLKMPEVLAAIQDPERGGGAAGNSCARPSYQGGKIGDRKYQLAQDRGCQSPRATNGKTFVPLHFTIDNWRLGRRSFYICATGQGARRQRNESAKSSFRRRRSPDVFRDYDVIGCRKTISSSRSRPTEVSRLAIPTPRCPGGPNRSTSRRSR